MAEEDDKPKPEEDKPAEEPKETPEKPPEKAPEKGLEKAPEKASEKASEKEADAKTSPWPSSTRADEGSRSSAATFVLIGARTSDLGVRLARLSPTPRTSTTAA
jgi:hypothetical protein